jgi:hypothetical protein
MAVNLTRSAGLLGIVGNYENPFRGLVVEVFESGILALLPTRVSGLFGALSGLAVGVVDADVAVRDAGQHVRRKVHDSGFLVGP